MRTGRGYSTIIAIIGLNIRVEARSKELLGVGKRLKNTTPSNHRGGGVVVQQYRTTRGMNDRGQGSGECQGALPQ